MAAKKCQRCGGPVEYKVQAMCSPCRYREDNTCQHCGKRLLTKQGAQQTVRRLKRPDDKMEIYRCSGGFGDFKFHVGHPSRYQLQQREERRREA